MPQWTVVWERWARERDGFTAAILTGLPSLFLPLQIGHGGLRLKWITGCTYLWEGGMEDFAV